MTIRRAIPTSRFGERSVALVAEIRSDRPVQAGRQRFAPDSPVEGDGFEPSVPVAGESVYIAEGELRVDRHPRRVIGSLGWRRNSV